MIPIGAMIRVTKRDSRFDEMIGEVVMTRPDAVMVVFVKEIGAMTVHFENEEVRVVNEQ